MRVFVLVPTYKAYLDWCVMRGVNPGAAECVTDPAELFGKVRPADQVIDARYIKPDSTARLVA